MLSIAQGPADVPREPRHRTSQDDATRTAISAALSETGYRSVSQLEIDVLDGMVVLTGMLPSFYMKQMAQEAVLKLDNVARVRNTVEVEWSYDGPALTAQELADVGTN